MIFKNGKITEVISDNHLRKFYAVEKLAIDEEKRQVRSIITNEDVDRDGDIMRLKGWSLDNFKKNPVVLLNHNYHSLPVGKSVSLERTDKGIISVTEFAKNEEADLVYTLIKDGFLNAYSVGFDPIEWEYLKDGQTITGIDFKKMDLLEYSVVTVPANPGALNLSLSGDEPSPHTDQIDVKLRQALTELSNLIRR